MLEFLTDYIIDEEEWAEKIYMEVGGNERQRLLNKIRGVNDTMAGVGDLLAKKNLQLQIDEYNERIQEIENGMLQITKKWSALFFFASIREPIFEIKYHIDSFEKTLYLR